MKRSPSFLLCGIMILSVMVLQGCGITGLHVGGGTVSGQLSVEYEFSWLYALEQITPDFSGLSLPIAGETEVKRWLVIFEPGTATDQQKDIVNQFGWLVVGVYPELYSLAVVGPEASQSQRIADEQEAILGIEPDAPIFALGQLVAPNDPQYSSQWNLQTMRLPQAWTRTTGNDQVRVAVLDSGVNVDHEDLAGVLDLDAAYNFLNQTTDVSDGNGHGTHVTGIIGAVGNNAIGIAGVMWDVSILPLKILSDTGSGNASALADAIMYAAGLSSNPVNPRPVDIINLSVGFNPGDTSLAVSQALDAALAAGVIVVAAAGNHEHEPARPGRPFQQQIQSLANDYDVVFPASHPGVVAVGAVGNSNPPERAGYSSYGPEIDFVAPGGNGAQILGLSHIGNEYRYMKGTSMATPHVAGLMGLMLTAGIESERIVSLLQQSATPLSDGWFDEQHGHGLVNAHFAVHGVEQIRILVGHRQGDLITPVAETTVGLREDSFALSLPAAGVHQVFAWIDVQGNNIIEPGDYFAQSEPIEFNGIKNPTVDLVLQEIRE